MISSQNPIEEIMNVLARQIPNAEDGADRRADLLSRVPRSSSAWTGILTLIELRWNGSKLVILSTSLRASCPVVVTLENPRPSRA